jgi:hypothetical protein
MGPGNKCRDDTRDGNAASLFIVSWSTGSGNLQGVLPVTDAKPDPTPDTTATTLPDRLCSNPKSPHYDQAVLDRDVGIKFNGVEKTNVEEYCVSEGWVRLSAGNAKDRFGNAMTVKLKGKVEPYFKG